MMSNNSKFDPHDLKKHYLQQKMKLLEENMMYLNRRLEDENTFFNLNQGKQNSLCVNYEIPRLTSTSNLFFTEGGSFQRNHLYKNFSLNNETDSLASGDCLHMFDVMESQMSLGSGDAPNILEKPPEISLTQPKLFFSWSSNQEDFENKRILQKISTLLEENEGSALDVNKLKESLENSPSINNEIGESNTEINKTHSDDGLQGSVNNYQDMLGNIVKTCWKDFTNDFARDDVLIIETDYDDFDEDYEDVEDESDREISELKENILLECLKESNFTDYCGVSTTKVVKEVEELEYIIQRRAFEGE